MRSGRSDVVGVGLLAATSVIIGTAGTAAELGDSGLEGLSAGSWRAVIGALGLVVLARWRDGRVPWSSLDHRWLLVGGAAVAVNQLAYFEAITRTGVGIGSVVTLGSGPIGAVIVGWWAEGARPSLRWSGGAAVAALGIVLLVGVGSDDQPDGLGLVLAVLAGMLIPVLFLSSQRLSAQAPFLTGMAGLLATAAVLLSPVAVASADRLVDSPRSVATAAYLGLVTVSLAYALLAAGLPHVSVAVAAVVALLEPVVATTLGVVVLDEPFGPEQALGAALVLVGVGVASSETARRERSVSPAGRPGSAD